MKVVPIVPKREHCEDLDTVRVEVCDGVSLTAQQIVIMHQRNYLTDAKTIKLLKTVCMRQRR